MKVREIKEKSIDKKYLNMMKPYLRDIIKDHKNHGLVRYHSGDKIWLEETSSEWKIELTMAINFISSEDSDKTRTMRTKSNNVEIMKQMTLRKTDDLKSETDDLEDLFESFLQKRGSEFVYNIVDVLYNNL